MNLFNYFLGLRRKTIEPLVYSVVYQNNRGAQQLQLTSAYCLDEAFSRFIHNLPPGEKEHEWRPLMWTTDTFMRLAEPHAIQKIERNGESPQETKNQLMQRILANNDVKLFEKNKKLFTEVEVKYLKEKLNV